MPFFFPFDMAVALPFGLNVISTVFPEGTVAEKGFPVANMVLKSAGVRISTAVALS